MNSHAKRYFACDFLTVDTAFLKRLYLFVVMELPSRQIVLTACTYKPGRQWLENIVRGYFCFLEDLPNTMISDRDGIYGDWFREFLEECFDIQLIRTPPRTPNCNAHVERWNRTFREEVLDHCIIFGKQDFDKVTKEYVDYYHHHRPHQGLGQDTPCIKYSEPAYAATVPRLQRKKMVDGIITNFSLAA